MKGIDVAGKKARVAALLEPVIVAAGFDLEELELRSAGRRTVVVVTVDGDSVKVDDLATLSHALSDTLDADGSFGNAAYTLEVSSRGVSRPLTLPRHWKRNRGRLVAVTLSDGTALTGRIGDCGKRKAEIGGAVVEYDDIARAVVQVEFSEPGE